ncbi:hypothetical protein [Alkalibacillus salilacus]|uniref:Outer membrane murein-binding lipoprotein Lpp n=1 Tax=Alkalibacillus salilacus TaxID=284582 RepID=A0ABT9VIU6_9BACI|nr:hypothetical protein [Alkalibacillus salilacus]MDQ0160885.1 outer membrane murein-binding lipoprotein Lpp [Alkalibacillus salilacus]
MKQWVSLISLSIILVACQSNEEPNNEAQVEQLTEQIQDQNEQIEKLQQELEEKTRELQQERQDETVQDNFSESNDETNSSSDQIARTENFQLQTPQEGESISDTFSIQGMIRYEAVGSVRVELIDADGNTIEETQIEEDWFTQTPSEREWTGIELNLTITSTMASGEGEVIVHDDLAEEEASVPIKLK